MRERITASILVLTLLLLVGGFTFRSYSLEGLLREHDNAELAGDARGLAALIDQRLDAGLPVDATFLAPFTADVPRITYAPPGGRPVTVVADSSGEDAGGGAPIGPGTPYSGVVDGREPLVATASAGGGMLTMVVPGDHLSLAVHQHWSGLLMLIVMVLLIAGIASFLVARSLSMPFRQLAVAAGALGRGRFDLDLPQTRIPEARAIAAALATSAEQIHGRLERDHAFAEHASHALRTPLTGLRLELEDMSLREDLPADVREAAARGLESVRGVDAVAGELVELSRRGVLVHGAELSLRELATQLAQRWADELAPHDRLLTAAVEGSIDLTYTPGPVEHLLDLVLSDVLARGAGAVRIVFEADPDGLLRIKVVCGARVPAGRGRDRDRSVAEPALVRARALVSVLGGRLDGDHPADGLVLLLPRR